MKFLYGKPQTKMVGNEIWGFFNHYSFMNPWIKTPITVEGITFDSLQRAFTYQKANRKNEKEFILREDLTPKELAEYHEMIPNPPRWRETEKRILQFLHDQKFPIGSSLAEQIVDTSNYLLLNENYWGDTRLGTVNGCGQNLLGRILMDRREVIATHGRKLRAEREERWKKEAIERSKKPVNYDTTNLRPSTIDHLQYTTASTSSPIYTITASSSNSFIVSGIPTITDIPWRTT